MANENYVIIPGTQQRVYEGSVVMLHRLPNLRWIIHNGYYNYNGRKQKGWYFASIPSDTTMPVFPEDLVAMTVIDGSHDPFPPGPCPPPGPGPFPPGPPVPVPIPFTPRDKMQVDAAMITVDNLTERDKMGRYGLQDGKVVRVNDIDGEGTVEYYSWNATKSKWEEASLGYRYMTRAEVMEAVGDDIVDIVWSNENGALVLTNHAGEPVSPVQLFGVSHDPVYTPEELTLRIPVYGKEDFVLTLPADNYLKSVRFEETWHFEEPEPHNAPAIVITVTDGETESEIAGDASPVLHLFKGKETDTATVHVNGQTYNVTANVKLSSILNNPLKVDNEGLWVDLSGVVGKKQIQSGFLLVADGNGEFTYGGNGIELETSTAIADLADPEKKVVTAKLVADAIAAAISAITIDVESRLQDIETRIDFGSGEDNEIVITSGNGFNRSGYTVGNNVLDPDDPEGKLATEQAIIDAFSWKII